MLNFGASKPRVKGARPPGPPGSTPAIYLNLFLSNFMSDLLLVCYLDCKNFLFIFLLPPVYHVETSHTCNNPIGANVCNLPSRANEHFGHGFGSSAFMGHPLTHT